MPGKKILVADDSLTIQKVIRLALSNEGYEIQAVSEGNEALQQIAVFRPNVVLVDVSLPGKSAFQIKESLAASAASSGDPWLPKLILMSSAFEKVDEIAVERARFDGRLTKPFDPAHLRRVLSSVLGPSLPSPEEIEVTEHEPSISLLPPPPEQEQEEPGFSPPPLPPQPDLDPPMSSERIPSSSFSSADFDIRNLTEKTIRMSGLDDFEWAVQEPSLKPLPSMISPLDDHEIPPPPAPSVIESYAPPPPQDQAPQPPRTSASSINIEEALKRQMQESLEKMAREILPEIAERVIKQEINKLLNEKL